MSLQKIKKLSPFKHFCMSIGVLPSSYMESMTYLELLMWLCKYLSETVIPTINNNGQAVEELQNLFLQLQSFVDNYFDNLDVQEEINNKLDDLVSDGTLQTLLLNFTNVTKIYNTHKEMLEDYSLKNNSKCKTLGFYNINDGGGASYNITNIKPTGTYYDILNNDLYAELIVDNNTINFKQLGARSEQDSNFSHIDCKPYLEKYFNLLDKNQLTLYIPSGIWCFSETLINKNNVNIIGDYDFFISDLGYNGTIITALNDCNYVWKLGGNPSIDYSITNITHHINLDNLCFSTGLFEKDSIKPISLYKVKNSALYIDALSFSKLPNLNFNYINGTALAISTSWELYFNIINFRQITDHETPIMLFDDRHLVSGINSPNISAIDIYSMMFERCNGNYIKFTNDCHFGNNHIHYINTESSFCNDYNNTGTIETPSVNIDYDVHESIIVGGQCGQLVIDSIVISLIGYYDHLYNGKRYVIDKIISHESGYAPETGSDTNTASYFRLNIQTLDIDYNRIPIYVISQNENIPISIQNRILINNLLQRSESNFTAKFNLKQYTGLYIDNFIKLPLGNTNEYLDKNITKINPLKNCSDFAYNHSSAKCIVSDENSISSLKTAVKSFANNTNTRILCIPNFVFDNMKIRCRIPSGETAQIFYNNGEGYTGSFPSFQGNGEYEWHNLDFTNKINPKTQNMFLQCGNHNVLFDVFYIN